MLSLTNKINLQSNTKRFTKPARGFYDKSGFQKDFNNIITKHENKKWFMRGYKFLRSSQFRFYRHIAIFGVGTLIMLYYMPGSNILLQKWLKKGAYNLKLTWVDIESHMQEEKNPTVEIRSIDYQTNNLVQMLKDKILEDGMIENFFLNLTKIYGDSPNHKYLGENSKKWVLLTNASLLNIALILDTIRKVDIHFQRHDSPLNEQLCRFLELFESKVEDDYLAKVFECLKIDPEVEKKFSKVKTNLNAQSMMMQHVIQYSSLETGRPMRDKCYEISAGILKKEFCQLTEDKDGQRIVYFDLFTSLCTGGVLKILYRDISDGENFNVDSGARNSQKFLNSLLADRDTFEKVMRTKILRNLFTKDFVGDNKKFSVTGELKDFLGVANKHQNLAKGSGYFGSELFAEDKMVLTKFLGEVDGVVGKGSEQDKELISGLKKEITTFLGKRSFW